MTFIPDTAGCLQARDGKGADSDTKPGHLVVTGTLVASGKAAGSATQQDAENGMLVAHALRADGFDASEDGTGRGTPLVVGGGSWPTSSAVHPGVTCRHGDQTAVAINLRGRDGGAMPELSDVASVRAASGGSSRSYVAAPLGQRMRGTDEMARQNYQPSSKGVRRLTPRECERLQGFPDDWTLVPYRGKPAADGPRYRAIGNSMAVPVMRWIGERIAAFEAMGSTGE